MPRRCRGGAQAKATAESYSSPLPVGSCLASVELLQEQCGEDDSDSDGDYDPDKPLTHLLEQEREGWTIQGIKDFLTRVSSGLPQREKLGNPFGNPHVDCAKQLLLGWKMWDTCSRSVLFLLCMVWLFIRIRRRYHY